MTRRYNRTVEVDLDDFDDEAILAAADEIRGRAPGGGPLDNGPITPRERLIALVGDLAAAIARGDQMDGLRRLDDLVGDDRALRDAIDMGRRRRR